MVGAGVTKGFDGQVVPAWFGRCWKMERMRRTV